MFHKVRAKSFIPRYELSSKSFLMHLLADDVAMGNALQPEAQLSLPE